MKRIKKFLSLFLASSLIMGISVQAQPISKAEDIAKLEVKVNGNGIVTIDDYESTYEVKDGETFKANTTVNTQLKITVNPNEGFSIENIVVNGTELSDSTKDEKAYSFEYTVSKNSEMNISFIKDKVVIPPVVEEEKDVATNDDIEKEEIKNEEEKEEVKEVEENLELKIIKEYLEGVKNTEEQIEFRKNLATDKNLLEFVDEDFFLNEEFVNSKSSAYFVDESIVALLKSMSSEELEEYANTLSNEIEFILDGEDEDGFKSKLSKFLKSIFGKDEDKLSEKALVTGGGMAVSAVYNGYTVTAPMLSINGKQAFCIQFEKPTPPAGTIATNQKVSSNEMLRKIMYYGYRGPGASSMSSKWTFNLQCR